MLTLICVAAGLPPLLAPASSGPAAPPPAVTAAVPAPMVLAMFPGPGLRFSDDGGVGGGMPPSGTDLPPGGPVEPPGLDTPVPEPRGLGLVLAALAGLALARRLAGRKRG